jgi:hypothetical protein
MSSTPYTSLGAVNADAKSAAAGAPAAAGAGATGTASPAPLQTVHVIPIHDQNPARQPTIRERNEAEGRLSRPQYPVHCTPVDFRCSIDLRFGCVLTPAIWARIGSVWDVRFWLYVLWWLVLCVSFYKSIIQAVHYASVPGLVGLEILLLCFDVTLLCGYMQLFRRTYFQSSYVNNRLVSSCAAVARFIS